MKAFAVEYRYRDLDLRAQHRAEHVSRLKRLAEKGVILLAGPREDTTGALLVIRADSLAEAEAIMAEDPYVLHNVIDNMQITGLNLVVAPAAPVS